MDIQKVGELLPERLRGQLYILPKETQQTIEELHIKRGQPIAIVTEQGERQLGGYRVGEEDIRYLFDTVTGFSHYTARETIREGFLTAEGGIRIGLCGTAVMEGNTIKTVRDISSVVVRIPREGRNIAKALLPRVMEGRRMPSTLIVSPPGCGKTTLLRDMVRLLSDDFGYRISLVDERSELAGTYQGVPQLSVGSMTDVFDGCPKAVAIPCLLRAMNPRIIAVDEITLPQDVEAVCRGGNAGVTFLATVHGSSLEDILQKPLYKSLLQQKIFQYVIEISKKTGERQYEVRSL